MTTGTCKRYQRRLALMAGAELSPRRAARLRSHLQRCGCCRNMLAELGDIGRLAAEFGAVQPERFASVRTAVRRQVRQAQAASGGERTAATAPLWAMWAPGVGVLAVAGILSFSVPEQPQAPVQVEDGVLVRMSSVGDDGGVRLTIVGSVPAVRRVAVSSRSDDFGQARVFEANGPNWRDPMPAPGVGEAFFYRVD